jgi:death-on-curing protein
MPETTFDGEYLHPSVFEMASAYLFHLVRNHPFVDGNKRTALMCALVFLGLNRDRLQADPDDLYSMVDGMAAGEVDKAEVSVFLRRHCVARWSFTPSTYLTNPSVVMHAPSARSGRRRRIDCVIRPSR